MTDSPIRPAAAAQAALLTDIALAAKAYWGYSEAQLALWRDDIAVSTESISTLPTFTIESGGAVVGFYQIDTRQSPPQLDHLWVNPAHIGQGHGRTLLRHARLWLADHGHKEVAIDADPYAEAFYLSQGARRIAVIAAPIAGEPLRVRPQLLLATGS